MQELNKYVTLDGTSGDVNEVNVNKIIHTNLDREATWEGEIITGGDKSWKCN